MMVIADRDKRGHIPLVMDASLRDSADGLVSCQRQSLVHQLGEGEGLSCISRCEKHHEQQMRDWLQFFFLNAHRHIQHGEPHDDSIGLLNELPTRIR